MEEIFKKLWEMLIEPVLEALFRHYPSTATVLGSLLVVWLIVNSVKRRRQKFSRISLHIHYNYKSRHEGRFESLATIEVFKDGLEEYKSGLGGTRVLTTPITSRDPAMSVVLHPTPIGDRKHFTVFINPALKKGEHRIPLEAAFMDPNVTDPKIAFQVPTPIKELVMVIQLPLNETIRGAWSSVFAPGKTNYKERCELWIWRNKVFVAVFRKTKPGWKYEVTWQYEESQGVTDSSAK